MFNSKLYITEIHINADADSVYDVLTDFANYPAWNPFCTRIHGEAIVGEMVTVEAVVGSRKMNVRHEILELVPGKALRWADVAWFTPLVCGKRLRTILPLPQGGVIFRNEMPLTGILAWLGDLTNGKAMLSSMEAENQALKSYMESKLSP